MSFIRRYLAVTLFMALFLWGHAAGMEGLPVYYGMQLAVPSSAPAVDSSVNLPYSISRLFIDLRLYVDAEGHVYEVTAAETADSVYVKYYRDYLKTMSFHPGTFKGAPVKQVLPARLDFRPYRKIPLLTFPVTGEGLVPDRDFYFAALRLNGISAPYIEFFPSYNFQSRVPLPDSALYPYILVKLALDSNGRPTGIENLAAVSPPFTEQILNAVNWARYAPLVINNRPSASECFLLISLLPQVSYPARTCTFEDSTLTLRDRVRVRLLPDTVGLMNPPLPRNIIDNKIVCASHKVFGNGEVTVQVKVDTLGKVRMVNLMPANMKENVLSALGDFMFFPALDYEGRRREFEGYLILKFNTSRTVGVDITWLSR